jgi:hypothetical protein
MDCINVFEVCSVAIIRIDVAGSHKLLIFSLAKLYNIETERMGRFKHPFKTIE